MANPAANYGYGVYDEGGYFSVYSEGNFKAIGTGSISGNTYIGGNLTVNGTLSKVGGTFKIDHPLDPANKYLYHNLHPKLFGASESQSISKLQEKNLEKDGKKETEHIKALETKTLQEVEVKKVKMKEIKQATELTEKSNMN